MLIIRRRRGESIVINEDIVIEILETSPTQVKLGIRAPKDVTVLRSEIHVTRDVNRAASSSEADQTRLSQIVEHLRQNADPTTSFASPTSKNPDDPSSKP